MSRILIVDDDGQLAESFARILEEEGHEAQTASSGEAGLALVRERAPDMVVMDIRMPGPDGLATLQAMHECDPRLPVIVMTAYGTTETAIEATKLGAFDYVLKPFEIPDILALIERALEAGRLMHAPVQMNVAPETAPPDSLIGQSEVMQEVYKAIGRTAPTDATVLIRGESGTGKELAARALYQHSRRSDKPFLVINCVAIPEPLLESELFGYEKGAFTGATLRRVGKIEQASGGTIFMDEIGDMPPGIQAKILRLLQEKSIERLGGRELIPVDVRIIAATNRDLEKALQEGRFREDLYYRLKVVSLRLPPLRERKGDPVLLAEYFLSRFCREMGRDNPGMSGAARSFIESHDWPGNVRELSNAIRKAIIFGSFPLRREDLAQAVSGGNGPMPPLDEAADRIVRQWIQKALQAGGDDLLATLLERWTGMVLREALALTQGNRTRAAALLGISRPTLHARMEKCGLSGRQDGQENQVT